VEQSNLKILYSCLSRSWGGMEMRTISGIEHLQNRKISVELLCFPESPIYNEAIKKGIKTYTAKSTGYFHPIQIAKTARLIKAEEYNLIHTQASQDLWLLVPALKFLRSTIPLILTKRVGSFIVKKDFLHRKLYERVDKVIAISEVIKRNLMETTSLAEDKIVMLHNGVNLNRFDTGKADRDKVRAEFSLTENDIVVGMLARFSPGKGHEEFLFAAKELKHKYENLKFLIVGEPSRGENKYAEQVKKLSSEYELGDVVIFTGFRRDTPDILSAMDIFAFPSHAEAFGQSLVEAMAMSKPSVCSNSDGVLDIAVDGVTSYLFESRNEIDFTKKLDKMISETDNLPLFGEAARKRVVEKFEIEKQTDKLVSIYKQML